MPGKFADLVTKGRVFSVSTVVAGLAIPISSTTAPTLALWNPSESGVKVNLLRYNIAYVSGTCVPGAVGFQFGTQGSRRNLDANNITKSMFTVFAPSQINPAVVGTGAVSKVFASAAGTNTLSAAIVNWTGTCFGLTAEAATANVAVGPAASYDFDGLFQLYPGQAVFPCASAASSALFSQTLWWEEVPTPDDK